MKLRFPYAAWQLSLSATAREAHGPQQRPTAKINEYNFKIIIKSLFKKKKKRKTQCMHAQLLSRVWLFSNSMDCSLPCSPDHGILQSKILEWVALSFSRGSSQPRDGTCVSCIGGQILYHWATQEAPERRNLSWGAHFLCILSPNPGGT